MMTMTAHCVFWFLTYEVDLARVMSAKPWASMSCSSPERPLLRAMRSPSQLGLLGLSGEEDGVPAHELREYMKILQESVCEPRASFFGGPWFPGAWTDTGMGTTTLNRLRMPGSLLIGERWVCRVRKSKCSRDANNRRHMFCGLRAHSDMICVIWHEINI
jgi:hypothetical protein